MIEYVYRIAHLDHCTFEKAVEDVNWFFQHGLDQEGSLEGYATAFLNRNNCRLWYKREDVAALAPTVLSHGLRARFRRQFARWALQGRAQQPLAMIQTDFPTLPAAAAHA